MSASRQSRSSQGTRRIMLPKRRVNSSKSNATRNSETSYRSLYSSYYDPSVIGRFVDLSCTRSVTSTELDGIVHRVTRPTVSSRGGVDLLDKDYDYNKPRPRKTLIVIPGLERRYMGLQKVNRTQMDQIVARLTRMTTAYDAKFGPCRNVWVDQSPKRGMYS